MSKLHNMIEHVLEVKINKPIPYNKIPEWFREYPQIFISIQDYDTFDELNYDFDHGLEEMIPDIKEKFLVIKSLYDKKIIECDYKYNGFDISGFKKIHTGRDDDDLYILLTKF